MSTADLLTDSQKRSERLRAAAAIYQTTDSILAGERLQVKVTSSARAVPGLAPAWTDGTTIYINDGSVTADDFTDIVNLHGLNFHELSHVLFTPRKGTVLVKWVIEHDCFRAFNILEDQRIESLLTARYPSTTPWLTAAILRWIVNDASTNSAHLLTHGRRYLPGDLRSRLRDEYALIYPRQVEEVEDIIDAYRDLVFPTDYNQATALIERFSAILDNTYLGSDPFGHCSFGGGEALSQGRPRPIQEQRQSRDQRRSADSKADKKSSPQPASPDQDREGEEEGTGSIAADGSAPSRSPREIARQHLAEVEGLDEVVRDVRRTQRQIRAATGGEILNHGSPAEMSPRAQYSSLENSLRQTLGRLVQDADPGWHRRESTGRINPVRWAIEQDRDTAFDHWSEGIHDLSSIETVILLDTSGSMMDQAESSANATWVIKRSLDSIGASTTVITYDVESRILYPRDSMATSSVRMDFRGGGTSPVRGLAQAAHIFAGSQHRHKLLVVLTDGAWHGGTYNELSSEDYIERMNAAGVMTSLGFMFPDELSQGLDVVEFMQDNTHRCHYSAAVGPSTLVPFMSRVITGLLQRQLREAG